MKSLSFNILFIMRSTRIKKNGLASIYARITTEGIRQELYTQCDGNPELWDQKKERALGSGKISAQVNETLNEFRAKIMEVRRTLLAEGYEANAIQIKQRYLDPQCDTLMLIVNIRYTTFFGVKKLRLMKNNSPNILNGSKNWLNLLEEIPMRL